MYYHFCNCNLQFPNHLPLAFKASLLKIMYVVYTMYTLSLLSFAHLDEWAYFEVYKMEFSKDLNCL